MDPRKPGYPADRSVYRQWRIKGLRRLLLVILRAIVPGLRLTGVRWHRAHASCLDLADCPDSYTTRPSSHTTLSDRCRSLHRYFNSDHPHAELRPNLARFYSVWN